MDYDACVNLGKHRVVCGFSWLLRVIDHEAVLMDPKLFSSWVYRLESLEVSGVVETEVSAARPPNFWPTRQAQRLAGGKALGELEANPQLNCYKWY